MTSLTVEQKKKILLGKLIPKLRLFFENEKIEVGEQALVLITKSEYFSTRSDVISVKTILAKVDRLTILKTQKEVLLVLKHLRNLPEEERIGKKFFVSGLSQCSKNLYIDFRTKKTFFCLGEPLVKNQTRTKENLIIYNYEFFPNPNEPQKN